MQSGERRSGWSSQRICHGSRPVLTCEEEGEVYTICLDISTSKYMIILMRVSIASVAHLKQA